MVSVSSDRRSAKLRNDLVYFTGKACSKGHIALRYASNAACLKCLRVETHFGRSLGATTCGAKTCAKGHVYDANFKRCPDCFKIWRELNKTEQRQWRSKHQREKNKCTRDWLNEYKRCNPCADCHRVYEHWVMEFDHLVPRHGDKSKMIGAALSTGSLRAVKKAMAECDLVCANCHNTRTYLRRIGKWYGNVARPKDKDMGSGQ